MVLLNIEDSDSRFGFGACKYLDLDSRFGRILRIYESQDSRILRFADSPDSANLNCESYLKKQQPRIFLLESENVRKKSNLESRFESSIFSESTNLTNLKIRTKIRQQHVSKINSARQMKVLLFQTGASESEKLKILLFLFHTSYFPYCLRSYMSQHSVTTEIYFFNPSTQTFKN